LAEVTRFCPGTLGKAGYDLPSMARGRSSPPDNKNPETIMSMHRSLAAALWLLAAAGAYAMAVSWADDAQAGKLHPWVLVVVFWAAAAVSAAIHHLSHYLAGQLAQLPEAFRHSRRYLGYARHIVSPSWRHLARGLDTLDSLRPHLAAGREVGNRVWPIARGRDLRTRSWRRHGAEADAPTAAQTGRMVEIGS
jgi:hypothetical protein